MPEIRVLPSVRGTPLEVLTAATPASWIAAAREHWRDLLIDHANCEKKAASTALSIVFAYPEDAPLTSAMSRLAREELRHLEQVQALMRKLGVQFVRQKPGRYGAGLRALMRTHEPARKLDLLITGALIEARSCERFGCLSTAFDGELAAIGQLYGQLARSEARHFELYLALARARDPDDECSVRLAALARAEAALATDPDPQLRFHSGAPIEAVSNAIVRSSNRPSAAIR